MPNSILDKFKPFFLESPALMKEKTPPNKSTITLKMDHPWVLFLTVFQYSCGKHFISTRANLA